MSDKVLITAALLYANGKLHFGHLAGAYLPADVHARFQRLMKRDVFFVSGSDEYGVAITMSAEKAGRTPREQVDRFHEINTRLFEELSISFDHYSRTTWKGHVQPVQKFFLDLLEKGFIEEKVTDQLYSPSEKRFLADRYVTGECPACGYDKARGDECPKCGASFEATQLKNPRSKETGAKLEKRPTKHWFLLLDKFKDELKEWLAKKNWKPNVVNFIKRYINDLHPRAITRDIEWGVPIPLPDTDGKKLYVWFDAPIGYISATMEWAQQQNNPDQWKKYWLEEETKLIHFIGKDNIPFHTAIFPAMCMGQSLPLKLVDEVPANEFYNLEGKKLSKSEGWYVDLEDFLKKFSSDQLRYTLASNAPETSDSEFTWNDFQLRCNSELLGKFGNFVNRVMVFVKKNHEGTVPPLGPLDDEDQAFLKHIDRITEEARVSFEQYKVRRAAHLLMELAQEGNVYFDLKKPWKLAKEDKQAMATTLHLCLKCVKALSLLSYPILPTTSEKICLMLGETQPLVDAGWEKTLKTPLTPGTVLGKPEILFRKIENEEIEKEREALFGNQKKESSVDENQITIDEFKKLDLRVGEIVKVQEIEGSQKLFELTVALGEEKRTILSGIKQHFTPESLIGKKVVVVANLKPAKLMGRMSYGMVLAAQEGETLELPVLENIKSGSSVK